MYIDCSVVICAGAATEVEALKKALAEAEEKAAKEQAARKKLKARVKEVQQELQGAAKKCEALEHDASVRGTKLAKAHQSMETAAALQEIQEAKKIEVGKKFFMQNKHVEEAFPLLTRIWSSPGAFADLPCSVSDAVEFYRA